MDMFVKPEPIPLTTEWLTHNCTSIDSGAYCFGKIGSDQATLHLAIEDEGDRHPEKRWHIVLCCGAYTSNHRQDFFFPILRYVQTAEEIYELCRQLCIHLPQKS